MATEATLQTERIQNTGSTYVAEIRKDIQNSSG
jgi:hypothetical protein